MASPRVVESLVVRPPLEGDVRVVAVTATSAATSITEFKGYWITIQAEGADIYLVFGDSAVTADDTATSGDTRAYRIPMDQERDFYLERNATYTNVALKTASGTATARYFRSN